MNSHRLPPPEKPHLELGYVRLTDSAPFIVAQHFELFEKYGLSVTLNQEVSWANVRDKLAVETLDGAQMPAPLPAMTTLGASGIRVPMLSGLTLSLNGNTITLAASLWHEVRMRCEGHTGAAQTARGLRAAIEARGGSAKLTLAVVHAFSTHMILLRTWLRAGGIDPDHDVRTIIVPPAQMVDSLATGIIDGYCVGEPWGSVAVHHGIGAIAAVGGDVWRNSPEKVLCVTQQWHARHPATHLRLRLALMEACAWLGDPGNRETAASLISTSRYLDLPSEWLLPSLTGRFRLEPSGPETVIEDFHVFDSEVAGFPWRSHTELLIAHCGELLGRPIAPEQARALAQQTARPDLFREGARHLGMVAPGVDRLDAHHAEILHQDRACDALMPSHGTRATPRPPRANR